MAKKKKEVKSIEVPNKAVWGFGPMPALLYRLIDMPLHGDERRARHTFVKMIKDQQKELNDLRVKILEDMAEKDKDGKPVVDKEGNYDISDDRRAEFQEEFASILDSTWVIDVLPSNKKELKIVRGIIEKSPVKTQAHEDELYQEIMAGFESL